jgi:hypothetical protein
LQADLKNIGPQISVIIISPLLRFVSVGGPSDDEIGMVAINRSRAKAIPMNIDPSADPGHGAFLVPPPLSNASKAAGI